MLRILVFSVLLALTINPMSQAQLTVRKMAADANPGIFISAFDGASNVRDYFINILKFSDWFTVVDNRQQAVYLLQARCVGQGDTLQLSMRLATVDGKSVNLAEEVQNNDVAWLVLRSVDKLIQAAFGNPGLCASRIAFVVSDGSRKEIFTSYFDGTDSRQVTRNQNISTEPSWSPAGQQLVYTLYENHGTNIVLADLLNKRQRRLSSYPGLNAGADLSPDGRWAALSLSREHRVDLYLMQVATGGLKRLLNDKAVESSPCWSPDQRQICYVSDKAGRPHLYVMATTGGQAKRLLSDPAETVSPDWSPVSNRICFATRAGGSYVIAMVDMNAKPLQKKILTNAAGDWESPSWAPDGRHIVCTRTVQGKSQLCMIDSWYGRILQMTSPGKLSLPSWSPLLNSVPR